MLQIQTRQKPVKPPPLTTPAWYVESIWCFQGSLSGPNPEVILSSFYAGANMVGNDGKKMNFWNPSTLESNILNTLLILSNGWIARGKSTTKQGKRSTIFPDSSFHLAQVLKFCEKKNQKKSSRNPFRSRFDNFLFIIPPSSHPSHALNQSYPTTFWSYLQ